MIEWFFDVLSPFAYLALPAVERIAEEREVRCVPILFGGVLKHWGQLGPAEIPAKRVHTYRLCINLAERMGVPFRMPPVHPFNPLGALRVLTALEAPLSTVRGALALVWAEGVDVSGAEGFARLCARLGVADADGLIAETGAKEGLRLATERAVAGGVFGVPTLAVEGELFWGVDAMPLALRFIGDRGVLRRGEMGRLGELGEMQRRR